MFDRTEYPERDNDFVPRAEMSWEPSDTWLKSTKRSVTPTEELMSLLPHQEPRQSVVELIPLKEILADAVDTLTDTEILVFDAVVIEGLSLRAVGRDMGTSKSSVHRTKQRAMDKLRERLQHEPTVIAQLLRMGIE